MIQSIKQKINNYGLDNKFHFIILVKYIFQSKKLASCQHTHTHTNTHISENSASSIIALEQDLTFREQEVLKAVKQAKSCQEIADELFISIETVKSHRKNIISKLGLRGKQAFRRYIMKSISYHP